MSQLGRVLGSSPGTEVLTDLVPPALYARSRAVCVSLKNTLSEGGSMKRSKKMKKPIVVKIKIKINLIMLTKVLFVGLFQSLLWLCDKNYTTFRTVKTPAVFK